MSLNTLDKIIGSGVKLTPMLQQYYDIKLKYPDILLLFRMGDFYELFFDDAIIASKLLNIALTHRGKIGETPIPMAGIPHHAASNYIDRITSQGHKAAICDQLEDPAMAKGIVKRGVTRIVSPAMPYDLDKDTSNDTKSIIAFKEIKQTFYLVHIDYSTGNFRGVKLCSKEDLLETIRLIAPRECITYLGQFDELPELKKQLTIKEVLFTHLSFDYFDAKNSDLYIQKLAKGISTDEHIQLHKDILHPMGALAFYILSTQGIDSLYQLKPFHLENRENYLHVTYTTLTGLEIIPSHKDGYKNSLLGLLDRTKTAAGSRALKQLFLFPSRVLSTILNRQKQVESFLLHEEIRSEVCTKLAQMRDLERIMTKVTMKRVLGSDLLGIASAARHFKEITALISPFTDKEYLLSPDTIIKLDALTSLITGSISDQLGAHPDKGTLIKEGYDAMRDQFAKLSFHADQELLVIEDRYKKQTSITNLKIKYNNITGYFIEVSKSHLDKIPAEFQRRQTLVNAERFTTKELQEFEKEVLLAKERLVQIEREIFEKIIHEVIIRADAVTELATKIAQIDAFQSLAQVAFEHDFVKPNLVTNEQILNIKGAFHPLVKHHLKHSFTSHSLKLDSHSYFGLITGPNMAGKTTLMREVAIIQLLAQIGSFVPAKEATLTVLDHLFSRLGASDNIQKGQSTFMVEMSETASILRHATSKSLIILDEVGRGTSTYDGLSIAWALSEYLISDVKAFTLFATHYHELIEVIENNKYAKNFTMATKVVGNDVEFLYQLLEEGAQDSFGIYVARLAGIPRSIESRASSILRMLEERHHKKPELLLKQDDRSPQEVPQKSYLLQMAEQLKEIDLNSLTPLEALNMIDRLKKNLG